MANSSITGIRYCGRDGDSISVLRMEGVPHWRPKSDFNYRLSIQLLELLKALGCDVENSGDAE